MKKFLKTLMVVMLSVIVGISVVACGNGDGKDNGEKGLLCKKIGGVYTIYKYVDEGKNVTSLDIGAELDKIETSLGVEITNVRIQAGAFNSNDTLKEIIVPATVTEIDKGAFEGMKKLEELTVPFVGKTAYADAYVGETVDDGEDDKVKSVDSERTIAHFFGTSNYTEAATISINYGTGESQSVTCYIPASLEKITIKPQGEYKIPACAFNGFSMPAQIVLDGTITEIGAYAFANNAQLSKIELPASVTKIHDGAFSGSSKLNSVNFASLTALSEIGDSAFSGTALSEVEVPATVKVIGNNAFEGAKVTKVTLSAQIEKIGNYAFYNCAKLTKVYVADTVTTLTIGVYAFGDCEKLTYFGTVANESANPNKAMVSTFTVGANAFDGANLTIA